jgi:galactose oxidase
VKGLSTDFLHPFLNSKAMAGKFAVGEFFDGNQTLVNQWIFNPKGMAGRPSAFDFPLKFMLTSMCNNPGRFNMADLDHAGLVGISPLNAVTFVENHDTDLNGGQRIVTNKMMAYAYILTSEGYPAVFYKDYSTDPNCYGLKPHIDNLIWIHEVLASGETLQRWKDFDVFAYERLSGPHLLVALNNDSAGPRTIRVDTGFGANVGLHDYTGHSGDVATDGAGVVTLTVPPNRGGLGYLCYSRQGQDRALNPGAHSVTQDFEGATDLDILPCIDGGTVLTGRIWCATGSQIEATPEIDRTGWSAKTQVAFELLDPDLTLKANVRVTETSPRGATLRATANAEGSHTLRVTASDLPATNPEPPYKLSVRYTAPRDFAAVQPVAADPAKVGRWSERFALPNAPIHTHLLPNGKVLFWGRRDLPTGTLDDHFCTPHIWDPGTGKTTTTPQPRAVDGKTVNLFCSGHTWLPNGKLLVTGGHFKDSMGIDQASIYDFASNAWTPLPVMNHGRWYPSVVTLANGDAVVLSGSFATADGKNTQNNPVPQVWTGTGWCELAAFPGDDSSNAAPIELFPCLHLAPDGRVFMSGPAARSYFLDTAGAGRWSLLEGEGGVRDKMRRDYAPSVMYDVGKIIYIGGGNDQGPLQQQTPTAEVEAIDLTAPAPAWQAIPPMHSARRQHNATLLPDGTVLVTGGTRGNGFNDLTPGSPVHAAELWDPATKTWTVVASESVDRCYHSTAILLPDATVLSAGGGEFDIGNHTANPAKDTHRDAQIYRPPYLFRGAQPVITTAPAEVSYGATFVVGTAAPHEIGKVTWIRLASTTHTNNMNQRINFLDFEVTAGELRVTSPARPEICPPGHYMLFVLNRAGVPSAARIVHIAAAALATTTRMTTRSRAAVPAKPARTLEDLDREVRETASGTQAAIGLTSKCPYGLGACWGGAYEALVKLSGVSVVRPIANAEDSTADVYLGRDVLPDVDRWVDQIAVMANGSYDFRGVEVSVRGSVRAQNGGLGLTGPLIDKPVTLAALERVDKVQFDRPTGAAKPATAEELVAYQRLVARCRAAGAGDFPARVTGPMRRKGAGWIIHVRCFEAHSKSSSAGDN